MKFKVVAAVGTAVAVAGGATALLVLLPKGSPTADMAHTESMITTVTETVTLPTTATLPTTVTVTATSPTTVTEYSTVSIQGKTVTYSRTLTRTETQAEKPIAGPAAQKAGENTTKAPAKPVVANEGPLTTGAPKAGTSTAHTTTELPTTGGQATTTDAPPTSKN